MSVANQRAGSARLSLVASKSSVAVVPTERVASTGELIPHGWFEEEIGYISEAPTGTRATIHGHRE